MDVSILENGNHDVVSYKITFIKYRVNYSALESMDDNKKVQSSS